MKKIIVIAWFITSVAGLSAFGQGLSIQGTVWDGFTTPNVSQRTANVNLALLWGSNGSIPGVASIMSSVPSTATVNSSTWQTASAWTAILTDPNFFLANGASGQIAVVHSAANGAYSFTDFPLGFPSTGALFVIGFDGNYATPALAAAANSAVGWSAPVNYVVPSPVNPPNLPAIIPVFGVAGIIPEPASMVLAGLGGLSLLLLRLRKSQLNSSSR